MFELQLFLNETINRSNESPLYKQIYEAIRKGILDRHLKIGTKLPSTRLIAEEICVRLQASSQQVQLMGSNTAPIEPIA